MLKHVAAAVVAGVAAFATGTALADGLPTRGSLKDDPVCCAAPNWNGFYIGAGIGYGHLVAKNDYRDDTDVTQSWLGEGGRGGLAGVVVGFDRVIRDRMVWGLFAEYDWSSIESTFQWTDGTDSVDQKFRLRDTVSIGSRTGYLLTPSTLLYLSGGYSWARGKSDGYFDFPSGPTGASKLNLHGWFVGGGMETALSDRLGLRTEVRYTKFDDVVTNTDGSTYEDRYEPSLLTGRLVLTYKLHREHHHVEPLK